MEEENAFQKLKDILTSEPILRGPDFNRPFVVQTDASDVGIGAVLSQEGEEGDQPVAFFLRKLLPREKNWATMDHKCLAIVEGIKHFAFYLSGVPFTVVTDHQCLKYLDSVRDGGGKRTRWTLLLQEYDFKVIHRPGKANGNADGLSRQAWDDDGRNVLEELGESVVRQDTPDPNNMNDDPLPKPIDWMDPLPNLNLELKESVYYPRMQRLGNP